MSTRIVIRERWNDPWYRKLSRDQRDVFEWLCDHCDTAGFCEIDLEKIAEETKIEDVAGIGGVVKSLASTINASRKGLIRSIDGGSKTLFWVSNYIKVQNYGKRKLDPANKYHIKILRILREFEDEFPEVKRYYMGGVYPLDASSIPHKSPIGGDAIPSRNGEDRIGMEEEEEEKKKKSSSSSDNPVESKHQWGDPAQDEHWKKMLEIPGLTSTISGDRFMSIKHDNPDQDWDKLVDHLCIRHANGGLDSAYAYLMGCIRRGLNVKDEYKGKDPNGDAVSKKKRWLEEREKATRLFVEGKVTDKKELDAMFRKINDEWGDENYKGTDR